MKFIDILNIIRARWRSAGIIFAMVIALALGATFAMTPQYTATASVVLDIKSPDPIAGVVLPALMNTSYMATQINVIQSERVILGAIDALRLENDSDLRVAWADATNAQGDFRRWIAATTFKKLDVTPIRDANVITLAFTSPDPVKAATYANALVQSYVNTSVELRTEPAKNFNTFFDERAKIAREKLELAQNKLSEYQQEKGIIITTEKIDTETSRLTELTNQLLTLQAVATESNSRNQQASSHGSSMPEVLNNGIVGNLTTELSRQNSRFDELSEKLGSNHPQVLEQTRVVANLKTRLNEETNRVLESIKVNNNINQIRLNELKASTSHQRQNVLALGAQRDAASLLLRDVENAQRAYEVVLQRTNQTGLESQATQTNVSIIKEASVPNQQSSPRILLNVAVAIFSGMILAFLVAILRELGDRRLRNPSDVVLGLGVTLLGTLPTRMKNTKKSVPISFRKA